MKQKDRIQQMRDRDQPIPADLDALMLIGALLEETREHGETEHQPPCPMTQDALRTCVGLLRSVIQQGVSVIEGMEAERN